MGRYFDHGFHSMELKAVWSKTWQWVCREEQIPEHGDYCIYEIGPYSFIVVRSEDGRIRAFFNSCTHRRTKLLQGGVAALPRPSPILSTAGGGGLDGTLRQAQDGWGFTQIEGASHGLPQARAECWGAYS